MAPARLRTPRLQPDDAVGDSGRDADRARVADRAVEFFRQHPRHAPAMSRPAEAGGTEFDGYASEYDAALAQGLSVSGEDKTHFARGRVDWLAKRLAPLQQHPRAVMDFGCGTGSSTP